MHRMTVDTLLAMATRCFVANGLACLQRQFANASNIVPGTVLCNR